MEAILHIGSGRTGTTSLQHFFNNHRELLESYGFGYTTSLGQTNNVEIAKYGLLNYNNNYLKNLNIQDHKRKDDFDKSVIYRLKAEVCDFEDRGINILIISSEHFTTDLRDIKCIEKIKQLFNHVGIDVVRIVLYLREQSSYLYSDFTTRAVMGLCTTYEPRIPSDISKSPMNHSHTISIWNQVFPKSKMTVRLFDRECLYGKNTINDFLNLIGIKNQSTLGNAPDINLSLSKNAIRFIIDYVNFTNSNSKYSHLSIKNTDIKNNIVNLARSVFQGDKLRPTLDKAKYIKEIFNESNEKVRLIYFPEREELFSYNNSELLLETKTDSEKVEKLQRINAFIEIFFRYKNAVKKEKNGTLNSKNLQ